MKIINCLMMMLLAFALAATQAQTSASAKEAKKATTSSTAKAADLVDINSATAEQLQALPGAPHFARLVNAKITPSPRTPAPRNFD